MLKSNSTLLFQGDSITDTDRGRGSDPSLGKGYPLYVAKLLAEKYADMNITVLNRAISGNRSKDLVGRWQKDCLDLKPDYVSILIGVNDTWRRYDRNDPTSDEDFEINLETVVRQSLDAGEQVILLCPYLLDIDDKMKMFEDLVGKRAIVKKIAEKYSLTLIDLHEFLIKKCETNPPTDFSFDGVHPSENGHKVIADEWVRVVMN